ncbi:GON-4-like protein [Parambassis ranga]|uniref:GON-4-like protein n=1 Tax=Parambassis ranga TaxID=210632 RepID=A0A6P7JX66_9TELE|nr:GON-4-like protein [Parambassis ranga]
MNPTRKHLRLSPSKPPPLHPPDTSGTRSVGPAERLSHEAMLVPPPATADSRAEEEEEYLLVEEDTTDSSLVITMEDSLLEVRAARRKAGRKRRRKTTEEEEEEEEEWSGASGTEQAAEAEVGIDRQLDQSLETKSKQHNLTTVNVRNILHEVITNEHVVAMMKAAINETEAVPVFEPKMTRSKFKEVVEKGVVIPTWNISPIKKTSDVHKVPQFVDIPLAEEDSSDEEYHPDEEEEDETAEETFQESDMESTASSPRGSRLSRVDEDSCSPWQMSHSRSRHLRVGSMGPPAPPKAAPPKVVPDSSFLEKLHAVEEELSICMEPYQPLSESGDQVGLMAYRTRSKRPLRDVPLGRLEAELHAPDITPDMYDSSSTHEDREWTDWLRGLMTSDVDNDEECDDEDDPEYNFLADIDEPDVEDYRDDKAVRITKKEVNELMEELFETLKEDLAGQEVDDEGHEEEEEPQEETRTAKTHTPEEQHDNIEPADEEQQDGSIAELRTVRQQLALIRRRRQTHTLHDNSEPHTLWLNVQQKRRLQQQLQQHIQLLSQVHLLTSPVVKLQSEAETTRHFLFELDLLAQRAELIRPEWFCSAFRGSNLQGALQLMEELQQSPITYQPQQHRPDARGHMRCFPLMLAELAWIFATRPVFLYPELLPCVSLDPALYCPRRTAAFTAAEDCLLVLGLRNMEGSCDPPKLVSQFLLRKTLVQVRRRILQCCRPGSSDNIVKAFRYQRVLWSMPAACHWVDPAEQRPPVEREESTMPMWLVRSLPVIHQAIKPYSCLSGSVPEVLPSFRSGGARHSHLTFLRSASRTYSFLPGTNYPARLPGNLDFRRIGFVLLRQPLPPPVPTPSPPAAQLVRSSRAVLQRLLFTRTDSPADVTSTSAVSMGSKEQLRRYCHMLAGLRRTTTPKSSLNGEAGAKTRGDVEDAPPPPDDSTVCQVMGDDVISICGDEDRAEEEEVESHVLLALSESSSSETGSVVDDKELQDLEPEIERVSEDDDDETFKETLSGESEEDEDEDFLFAQDYLNRVCETLQVCPDRLDQLLRVLEESSGRAEVLYDRLSQVLESWPQLLRDFAAFLNLTQARRCGLLLEQQLFERSRRFLRQLAQNVGKSSALYQQVVSVLQGSSAFSSQDVEKLTSLLRCYPQLQQEVRELFLQLHLSPRATASNVTNAHSVSLNPLDGNKEKDESESGKEEEEEEECRVVCAKNVSLTSTGEKVVVWTREADRTILTACRQRGASRKTFQQVSAQLGNKTVQQVRLRFHDLMKLFHSSLQKCSSEGQLIDRREAAPD